MTIKKLLCFLSDFVESPQQCIWRMKDVLKHGTAEAAWFKAREEIRKWSDDQRKPYEEEIKYIENSSDMVIFPYPMFGTIPEVASGYDADQKLPFAVHKGQRLYYRKRTKNAKDLYCSGAFGEGLLGTGCMTKSPHSYVDKDHFVEEGDVVLDIGCAEALFALDSIDKASRVYLFECEKSWRKPLRATFDKFGSRVVFVEKIVSDKTAGNCITLEDALKEPSDARFFMKMDIEGWEQSVLKSSERFLKSHRVKLSCCTYHRQDDAEIISNMLKQFGFTVRFSDGYMLPCVNGSSYPYFRKGMIYARNY